MQNSAKDKIFNDADDVKSPLIQFFAGKNQKYYEHVILTLTERLRKRSSTNTDISLLNKVTCLRKNLEFSFLFEIRNQLPTQYYSFF